jgi:uncharacterized repeat protein (TIGR01451 family)
MATTESHSLVLVSKANGYVIVPQATPLTRLNYFDGKFLRASDLKAEQDYLRQLVALSNQAGGAGVAHGFDLTLGGGDSLQIGAGLAIDPAGRVLLLPQDTSVNVQDLIEKSRALQTVFGKTRVLRAGEFEECELSTAPPPVDNAAPNNIYVIVISPADALCGEEDVYGKLCEEACATSTDRPFAVEGLIVRAVPLVLRTPLPSPKVIALTQTHLRSRVASAFFEDERRRVANLISKAGLDQETWCLGADAAGGSGVPIGVIARSGASTIFLDAWTARRERIDTPAKRYWQWRMMMRPWDVFLAQVLQFQCQLHDLFIKVRTPGGDVDPCSGAQNVINEATATIAELKEFYSSTAQRFTRLNVNLDEAITFRGGLTRLTSLHDKLIKVREGLTVLTKDRLLITGGIVELPSAGYLPVVPGAANTVNLQVRRMMGEGVDLRFCVVRPDYVAHALEEAQHMERISLLQGLDNPKDKPEVDILVPDGEVLEQKRLSPGTGFEASVDVNSRVITAADLETKNQNLADAPVNFRGAARADVLSTGGGAFYLSAAFQSKSTFNALDAPVKGVDSPVATRIPTAAGAPANAGLRELLGTASFVAATPSRLGLWMALRCDANVFSLSRGDTTNFNARAIVASTSGKFPLMDVELNGAFQVTQPSRSSGTENKVAGHIENARLSFSGVAFNTTGTRTNTLVDLDSTVTLTGGSAIEVVFGVGRLEFVLAANWGKQPLEISANIVERVASSRNVDAQVVDPKTVEARTSIPGTQRLADTATAADTSRVLLTLADADLRENADVLSDKDSRHIQALAALEVIGKVLNDSNFADAKARLLFPAPPKPTDELLVRATRDWVLFHRRRTRRCSQEICVAPVAPARQYQVYHLPVGSIQDVAPTKKKLLAGGIPDTDFNKLPLVDFAGGLATLATDPQAWRQDWANIKPGNSIVYAGIANRDTAAADGDTLALTRLGRLVDAVAPVSTRHSQMESELLNQVPGSIPASSVDGVIFLFTIKAADLKLIKGALPADVRPGEDITYRIELTNAGPEPATNVVVTDPIPANTRFKELGATPAGWTAAAPTPGSTTGNVTFSKASVAPGDTVSFQIVVTASRSAGAGAAIVNTASVTSATSDPNTADNTATITTPFIQQLLADLVIAKTVDPPQFTPGSILTYALTVTNVGPATATNVEVKDVLPAGTTFSDTQVPAGWKATGPGADRTVIFTKPSMAAGDTATLSLFVRVPTAGAPLTIVNTATVESAVLDPVTSNNSATVTATRTEPQTATLTIRKSANSPTVISGKTVSYRLTLINGPSEAREVKVTDTLFSKAAFVSAQVLTGSGWDPPLTPPVGSGGGNVLFTKKVMAPNENAVFEIVVGLSGEGPVVNRVNAAASNVPNPDSAEVTVNVVQPDVTRTAVVVFTQPGANGRQVLPGSGHMSVNFTNNIPDSAQLDIALKGFPTGSSIGRFRQIRLAGTVQQIDPAEPEALKRLDAVAARVKAMGGTVASAKIEPLVSGPDRIGLAAGGVNLTGIDEVIFMDLG